MQTNTPFVVAYNSSQIAYPVGEHKDSYSICSFFRQNIETEQITATHEVTINWASPKQEEGVKYKVLFKGSYKDCVSFIKEIVDEQGLWTRNPLTLNYMHPKYTR